MNKSPNKNSLNETQQDLIVGDIVRIRGVGLKGQIIKINRKAGTCQVEISGKIIKSDISRLRRADNSKKDTVPKYNSDSNINTDKQISIDLHGFTKFQAEEALISLLNTALMQNVYKLEIIHGHGNGILKKVVSDFLTSSEYISRFNIVEQNTGTTIAYIK